MRSTVTNLYVIWIRGNAQVQIFYVNYSECEAASKLETFPSKTEDTRNFSSRELFRNWFYFTYILIGCHFQIKLSRLSLKAIERILANHNSLCHF